MYTRVCGYTYTDREMYGRAMQGLHGFERFVMKTLFSKARLVSMDIYAKVLLGAYRGP